MDQNSEKFIIFTKNELQITYKKKGKILNIIQIIEINKLLKTEKIIPFIQIEFSSIIISSQVWKLKQKWFFDS